MPKHTVQLYTKLLLVCAVFSVLFLFHTPKNIPAQSLTAQASGATETSSCKSLSSGGTVSAQKRAENLLKCLEELRTRLEALQEIPPPSLQNAVQFLGTGTEAGRTIIRFKQGEIMNPGDTIDETLMIKNTLTRPLTFTELSGLTVPFTYKGGTFPGAGGTCALSLGPECTVILTFSPTGTGGRDMGSLRQYTSGLKVLFRDTTNTGESNILAIGGLSESATSLDAITAEISRAPNTIHTGDSETVDVRVGLKDPLDSSKVRFNSVSVSGLTAPFSLLRNRCSEQAVHPASCLIQFSFNPSRAGSFEDEIQVMVTVGDASRAFSVKLSGTALPVPETLVPAQNLLVVYNEDFSESVEAKNYYLANRPGFSSANTFGVHYPVRSGCTDNVCLSQELEMVPYAALRSTVVDPIFRWLQAHPEKDIRFVVLMRGLPNRSVIYNAGSVQANIYAGAVASLGKEIFVSSLDMGSLEATKRYIDKLKTTYNRMPAPSLLISSQGTGRGGTTYYFDDWQERMRIEVNQGAYQPHAQYHCDMFTAARAARTECRDGRQPRITAASDVAGYLGWGYWSGWSGEYPLNGSLKFTGNSNWYLIQTFESHNGQSVHTGDPTSYLHYQGNFVKWFSKNAFGASDYEHTPAAAVTHVDEPYLASVNTPYLFTCWDSGKPFAYCAWASKQSIQLQAVGDPWITK